MGWLTGLFSSTDNTGKVIDMARESVMGIGSWIDNMDYTEEEKAKDISKSIELNLKLIEMTATENSIRSITRRYMAWGIVGFMLFWSSIAMGFAIYGKEQIVVRMLQVVEAFSMGMAFTAVIALYFGVQFIRK